jgi:hypothetical protein
MIFFFPLFPHKNKNNDWKYYNGTNYFAVIGYLADGKLIKDKKLYLESTISFFGDHRFTNEHLEYYKEIRFLICDYDRIINYSVDRTLTYICDKKNRIVSTYPRAKGRPIFKENKLEKKFNNENLNKNEIIIAGKDFFNNNLKLLKIITMPRGTRYTHSDVFMRYFDSEIYLYIKN